MLHSVEFNDRVKVSFDRKLSKCKARDKQIIRHSTINVQLTNFEKVINETYFLHLMLKQKYNNCKVQQCAQKVAEIIL